MAAKFKQYRSILNSLKKHCSAAYPVSVRRVPLTQHEGRCWKHGKKFHIQIDSKLDEYAAINVLLHEWAHARGWNHRLDTATDDEAFNKLAHDAAWGVAYAEVYALYEKIILTAAL
jgi:hypothetical protein